MVFAIGPAGTGKTYTGVALGSEGTQGKTGKKDHPYKTGSGSR